MNMDIPYPILAEEDIQQLFIAGPKTSLSQAKSILAIFGVFAVIFVITNFAALKNSLSFQRPEFIMPPETRVYANPPQEKIPETKSEITPTPQQEPKQLETDVMKNNDLYIPSLKIQAPINWNVTYEDKAIQESLKSGLVHLNGTAQAGEKGNVVITGHSSYFSWANGNYKTIFATLPKIQLNDKIYIIRGGTLYTYQVKNIYEVTPDKTEVLALGDQNKLTLVTCTPVGTALRRLIVEAEQISPDPAQNQSFSGTPINVGKEIPAVK